MNYVAYVISDSLETGNSMSDDVTDTADMCSF